MRSVTAGKCTNHLPVYFIHTFWGVTGDTESTFCKHSNLSCVCDDTDTRHIHLTATTPYYTTHPCHVPYTFPSMHHVGRSSSWSSYAPHRPTTITRFIRSIHAYLIFPQFSHILPLNTSLTRNHYAAPPYVPASSLIATD